MISPSQLNRLRKVITENLRVQRGGADHVPYIDVNNALIDVKARQNHAIFGRRGCGKSLLLHHSVKQMNSEIKTVYLNCEDFKTHSFPNVIIEILDAVFAELHKNLTGWFGKKRKSREIISDIRKQLAELRRRADEQHEDIREATTTEVQDGLSLKAAGNIGEISAQSSDATKKEVERTYKKSDDKLKELNIWLPRLKSQIREFFDISSDVKVIFIQIDDFYHLRRTDQPFVMDYVHRLCKDLPLYFKVATLRHASVLYADRGGQPTGAQERHDYQPINIDFTFADFRKTETQLHRIFYEFAKQADVSEEEFDSIFKGNGFKRLVMAGGGVPRDCLSVFLEVADQAKEGDQRVGKDEVRILSRMNFERRIEELKQDSEGAEQSILLKGIYVIRRFCLEKKTNVFFVSEQMLQQEDKIREIVYRLLDYRIIHSAGTALTHKSQPGTFHAFVIDVGAYAHMRRLQGRFNEVEISDTDAKEKMRSSPILGLPEFRDFWQQVQKDPETALKEQENSEVV
jgi:hypothetical protein